MSAPSDNPPPGKPRSTFVSVGLSIVETPAEKRAFVAGPIPPSKRVAVLVAHGMGQQVPFETLEATARSLGPHLVTTPDDLRVNVRLLTADNASGEQIPRAEVLVRRPDGSLRLVHFFEAYWAPLTEGKVTARDSVLFLLSAGVRGIRRCMRGTFERWMFDAWQSFPVSSFKLSLAFTLAALTVLSLTVINAVVVAAGASHSLVGNSSPWPTGPLAAALTKDLAGYEALVAFFLLLGIGIPLLWRRLFGDTSRACVGCGWAWSGFVVLAAVAIVAAGGSLVGRLLFHHYSLHPRGIWTSAKLVLPVWSLSIGIAFCARWFLREYVGDVAAYVSSYKVSQFDELRNQIQAAALKIFRFAYAWTWEDEEVLYKLPAAAPVPGEQSPPPNLYYDEFVVVGHSLGSVIGYDTLDKLLDLEGSAMPLRVAERTTSLLTFGSPLDKTAFIFRNQKPRESDIREALAAAKQPMILSYNNRPRHWVNIWSPADWISGSLEFYDKDRRNRDAIYRADRARGEEEEAKRIDNLMDTDACVPLAAHTMYWGNSLFAETLFELVCDEFEEQA